MGGAGQPGNQNPSQQTSQSSNKRKRLNDQPDQRSQQQQSQQQQQQQQQQQYSQQSQLFASDPTLQSRYAGLSGTGYRATPGVPSSLQPTLGDAIPQPVTASQTHAPTNGPQSSDSHDAPARPSIGSEEWHRQRRDNHKEVERRRRETINDGISELAKIVPGCEKNKGSILARAVQYIQQLKENESHNIEKWTLEKLLTDQAMAELQQTNEKLKLELERAWREAEAWKKTASREDSKRG